MERPSLDLALSSPADNSYRKATVNGGIVSPLCLDVKVDHDRTGGSAKKLFCFSILSHRAGDQASRCTQRIGHFASHVP